MKKQDCKAALEIYKKFVNRMERVSAFLSVAEDVGIDKGDIPDLTQAPGSLLTALENHLQSLEKGKAFKPPSKYDIFYRDKLVHNTKQLMNKHEFPLSGKQMLIPQNAHITWYCSALVTSQCLFCKALLISQNYCALQ